MNAETTVNSTASNGNDVCSWRHVHWFDNFLRPLVHDCKKMFGPYVRRGMTVMDIGCGRGFASLGLARLVGREGLAIATDLQPEMLKMVEERAARAGLSDRIRVHRCRADRIGVTEKLDFALAFWMVHEVPDARAFLREVFAQLKPGGRFFMVEPAFHVSRRDFERIVGVAEGVGFRVFGRPRVFFSRAVVLEK